MSNLKNTIFIFLGILVLAAVHFNWVSGENTDFLRNLSKQLEERTHQLILSIENFKAARRQLIQSERAAPIGVLTADIANEIKNPLNFANNLSEVYNELISELVDEVDKVNIAEVKLIATDIKENSEKINPHGKRADAIVKGMLQYSRSGSGKKEPTDINALADEYFRLAYHGLKAKDNSSVASFKTEFEPNIGKINIVSRHIGRVLLNLINNGFFAVTEKSKSAGPNYQPTVTVSTILKNDAIEISVADNGNGISEAIKGKIFQPFFSTKPTGQCSGFGLSLSYDIVKAHGGELTVETLSAEAAAQAGKEGEGSTFTINLLSN